MAVFVQRLVVFGPRDIGVAFGPIAVARLLPQSRAMTTDIDLLVLGWGYSARHGAACLTPRLRSVSTTARAADKAARLVEDGIDAIDLSRADAEARLAAAVARASHVLVSAGPNEAGDPFLPRLRDRLAASARAGTLRWIGYLSTVGVYGNAEGGIKGCVAGSFVHGLLITFLPAICMPVFTALGFTSVTFSDADFSWMGILWGNVAQYVSGTPLFIIILLCFAAPIVYNFVAPKHEAKDAEAEKTAA